MVGVSRRGPWPNKTTESLQRLFPPPKTHTSIAATGPVVSPTTGPFLFHGCGAIHGPRSLAGLRPEETRPSGPDAGSAQLAWFDRRQTKRKPKQARRDAAARKQPCRPPAGRFHANLAIVASVCFAASGCWCQPGPPGLARSLQATSPRLRSASIRAVRVSMVVGRRFAAGAAKMSRSFISRRPPDCES